MQDTRTWSEVSGGLVKTGLFAGAVTGVLAAAALLL